MFSHFYFTELNSKKVKSLETELNEMTSAYKQIMDDLLEKVDEIETYVLSRSRLFSLGPKRCPVQSYGKKCRAPFEVQNNESKVRCHRKKTY